MNKLFQSKNCDDVDLEGSNPNEKNNFIEILRRQPSVAPTVREYSMFLTLHMGPAGSNQDLKTSIDLVNQVSHYLEASTRPKYTEY